MLPHSPNGEVFGAKVLYGLMVALAAAVLFGAVASTIPASGWRQAGTPAAAETAAAAAAAQVS